MVTIGSDYSWPKIYISDRPLALSTGHTDSQVDASFQLATTCVDSGRAQIRRQVDASKFSQFGHTTQVDKRWSQVNCIGVKFTASCDLRELASRLATLRKSVRKFWFCKLVLTCVDFRVRLARALQHKQQFLVSFSPTNARSSRGTSPFSMMFQLSILGINTKHHLNPVEGF